MKEETSKMGIEDCYLDSVDGNAGGVVLEFVLFFYCMAGLAIVCDDHLVVALETLVQKLKVPEDVAGASFMAFGSAAPEIIINAVSTLKAGASNDPDSTQATDLGIGAILGSGMIAFCVIPCACALSATETLKLKRRPLLRDIMTYGLALACLCIFFGDGEIQLFPDAICLVLIYVLYIIVLVLSPKIRRYYRLRRGKVVRTTTFVEDQRNSNRQKRLLEEGEDEDTEENKMSDVGDAYVSLEGEDKKDVDYSFRAHLEYGLDFALSPLRGAFAFTCPPCTFSPYMNSKQKTHTNTYAFNSGEVWTEEENTEEGRDKDAKNPYEWTWPITFVVAFIWVSVFSFVISAVVQRWCELLNADVGFFGMAIVAVGAEIPDTIQSVTVAKRGYGAMAVSNCLGSQICNICLGLGLPWTISNLLGKKVGIHKEEKLQKTAFFQVGIVAFVAFTLLGFAIVQGENKASLTKMKGRLYSILYAGVLTTLAVMAFS